MLVDRGGKTDKDRQMGREREREGKRKRGSAWRNQSIFAIAWTWNTRRDSSLPTGINNTKLIMKPPPAAFLAFPDLISLRLAATRHSRTKAKDFSAPEPANFNENSSYVFTCESRGGFTRPLNEDSN